MTDYRALTQGGIQSGSQVFTAAGSFTAPAGVYKVYCVQSGNGSETPTLSLTPGKTYWFGIYGRMWNLHDDNRTGDGDSWDISIHNDANLTVSWSNAINNS